MSDKIIKKNQFQIRKVPMKRFHEEKLPESYALDIHSIGLPKKNVKRLDWMSVHYNSDSAEHQELTRRVIQSQSYKQLYNQYIRMREQKRQQKQQLQQQIDKIDVKIQFEKWEKLRLGEMRDQYCTQIDSLREQLSQCRNRSYNLRWEIYHQRGTYYLSPNHYSFLDNNDPTYQEYLMLQQQMGNVSKGLNEIQLALLPKTKYQPKIYDKNSLNVKQQKKNQLNALSSDVNNPQSKIQNFIKQICCICYDEINQGEYITILQCKHFNHCDCIKDWLAKQKNCPICKKEVDVDYFHLNKSAQTKNQYHHQQQQ